LTLFTTNNSSSQNHNRKASAEWLHCHWRVFAAAIVVRRCESKAKLGHIKYPTTWQLHFTRTHLCHQAKFRTSRSICRPHFIQKRRCSILSFWQKMLKKQDLTIYINLAELTRPLKRNL
jgi:hypothetical protein